MSALTNKINILSEINTGDNNITVSALGEGLTESAAITMTYSVGSLKYSEIASGENKGYYQCDGIDGEGVGNVEIASKVNGFEVREIAASAFYNETNITSFTIPDTIVKINENAFAGTNITSIAIPHSVKAIDYRAFRRCHYLETVTFKTKYSAGVYTSNLTTLGAEVFSGCNVLGSISLPDSLTSMGEDIFYNCIGLYQVFIGNGLTEIPKNAFWQCTNLQTVVWGDSVTSIGAFAFYGCSNLTTHMIPQSVTWIGALAYKNSGLSTLEVGDSRGWFVTDSDTVPVEIKDGETCSHVVYKEFTPSALTNRFVDKNWFKLDQIPAPTISIDDGVLTVTDYSGLAETFKIYVNYGDPIEVSAAATIVPGTWIANDKLIAGDVTDGVRTYELTFTSEDSGDTEHSFDYMAFYFNSDGQPTLVYTDEGVDGAENESYHVYESAWLNNNSKTIVITEVGNLSAEFVTWFLANFTLVSE